MKSWLGGPSLRGAIRSLASTPRLTLPALACIAVGVAAAQVIAALAYTVLFRAPALPDADRLARVWLHSGTARIEQGGISYLEYRDLLGLDAFDRVAAAARTRVAVRTAAGSERLRGEAVSSDYFELVGVEPILGRAFTPAEHRAGAPVALLGHQLWQRQFGGERTVVGRPLVVRGSGAGAPDVAYTIVGVLPPRFVGTVDPDLAEVWMPLEASPHRRSFADREARSFWVLARLAPARSAAAEWAAAEAEVAALGRRYQATQPQLYAGSRLSVERFGESWRAPLRPGLLALLGAAALLLLVACSNVAHLLLARLVRRESELVLRLALGASRVSLLRKLALEALLLAFVGGAAGLLLAQAALYGLAGEAALELPSYVPFGLDARLVLLALFLVLATALLFGVLPAAAGSAVEPQRWRGGRGLTLGARHRRLDRALVVGALAVTVVLVVAGGLLVRSYQALAGSDVGFRRDHLLRLAITLDPVAHPDAASVLAFAERAREVVRSQPGVRGVAAMSEVLPPWFDDSFALVHDGVRDPELGEVARHSIDRELLRVLDVPLVAGRPFAAGDRAGAQPVALVSASLARRIAGGDEESSQRRVLGRRVQLLVDPASGTLSPPVEVVGVVEDLSYHGPLGSRRAPHDLYVPFEQLPSHVVSFAVWTSVPPETLATPLQRAIGRLSPLSPMHWISTMEDELRAQIAGERFYGRLAGFYGASAALLALLGVYGVMANAVARRRGELAIRAAVGAGRSRLVGLVLGEAGRLLVAGLALGGAAALVTTRALRGMLHGVAATDATTYAATAAAMLLLGLLASYLPARRAATTDPARVLREDA